MDNTTEASAFLVRRDTESPTPVEIERGDMLVPFLISDTMVSNTAQIQRW